MYSNTKRLANIYTKNTAKLGVNPEPQIKDNKR